MIRLALAIGFSSVFDIATYTFVLLLINYFKEKQHKNK
jgi:hypothetical protein